MKVHKAEKLVQLCAGNVSNACGKYFFVQFAQVGASRGKLGQVVALLAIWLRIHLQFAGYQPAERQSGTLRYGWLGRGRLPMDQD